MTVKATRSGTEDTASGTYTFHVGPISELEVRDGGASPLASTGERAYTITAQNNGPDAAPAVVVTLEGVPEGSQPLESEYIGDFQMGDCANGFCAATWRAGRLPLTDGRAVGRRTELLTLTLLAPSDAPATDITATISNTEDYSLCLDSDGEDVAVTPFDEATCEATSGNNWHSTYYFDFKDSNDRAEIASRPGTVVGLPAGTPDGVSAQLYAHPPTAVVRWEKVDGLNLWPVAGYEVGRTVGGCQARPSNIDRMAKVGGTFFVEGRDDGINPDETYCYYVRALNEWDVAGQWSQGALASTGLQATPRLSARAGPAVTEGEDASFTISAFPRPNAGESLTVSYTVSQQGDFVDASNLGRKQATMTDSGELRIPVPTQDDDVDELNSVITVTLNSGDGYQLSSARSASVQVRDDETSEVNFVAGQNEATVGEDSGRHDVVVAISPSPAADLTIHYTVSGTATAGDDYRITGLSDGSGSVTARAGQSQVSIPLQVINDNVSEIPETVVLTLSASDDYDYDVISPSAYTLTITDNDGVGVSFDADASSASESGGTSYVAVNLVPAPSAALTINYGVSGSARADDDYTITDSRSVTADPGDTRVTIPVTVVDDTENESDETVVLTLLVSAGYNIVGAIRTHTLTIQDNDRPRASFNNAASSYAEDNAGPHNVTVSLNPPAPSGGLTLRYRVNGGATRGRDYTMDNYGSVTVPAGQGSVDIPVTISDDAINEAAETVILTLQPGPDYGVDAAYAQHTLTIADNDSPLVFFAQGDASVRESNRTHQAVITLDPRPHADIRIHYSVAGPGDGVAVSPDDYTITGLTGGSGSVTARAGSNRVVIPIAINDDMVAESDETVTLTLVGGTGYTLPSSPQVFTLTIEDNDKPTVSFPQREGSVSEDGTRHDVTVQLNGALDSDTTVHYRVEPRGRATAGDDYTSDSLTGATGTVTIPRGSTSAVIRININDDPDYEGEEMIILTLTEGLYNVGSASSYQLTIEDDDPAPDGLPVVRVSNPDAYYQPGAGQCEIYERQGGCIPTFFVVGGAPGMEVVIKYVGGTATLGEDFEFCCGTIGPGGKGELFTVTSGDLRGTHVARIGLSAKRDQVPDNGETIMFRVVNGPGYTVLEGDTDYIVTIRE